MLLNVRVQLYRVYARRDVYRRENGELRVLNDLSSVLDAHYQNILYKQPLNR